MHARICATGYKLYGFNRGVGVAENEGKTGIWYREWAPGAKVGFFLSSRLVGTYITRFWAVVLVCRL